MKYNYGNKYADFCPLSLNEDESKVTGKYSYIGNCRYGTRDYGSDAFLFMYETSQHNYKTFSPSYGENFSDISFCAFSSSSVSEK